MLIWKEKPLPKNENFGALKVILWCGAAVFVYAFYSFPNPVTGGSILFFCFLLFVGYYMEARNKKYNKEELPKLLKEYEEYVKNEEKNKPKQKLTQSKDQAMQDIAGNLRNLQQKKMMQPRMLGLACPNCGAPVKVMQGDVTLCPYCKTTVNG